MSQPKCPVQEAGGPALNGSYLWINFIIIEYNYGVWIENVLSQLLL